MNYVDFQIMLVPEDNGKQNPEVSYTSKYKKHVAYSYGFTVTVMLYGLCLQLWLLISVC